MTMASFTKWREEFKGLRRSWLRAKNAAVLWRTRGGYVTIVAIPAPVVSPDRGVAEGSGQDRVRPSEGRISGLTVDMSLVAKKAGGTEVPRGSCWD